MFSGCAFSLALGGCQTHKIVVKRVAISVRINGDICADGVYKAVGQQKHLTSDIRRRHIVTYVVSNHKTFLRLCADTVDYLAVI